MAERVTVFDFNEDFRDYLKHAIEERRLSYRGFAAKAGMDHRLIYDVVNKVEHRGKPRHLTLVKALKISDALGHQKNERDYFTALVFMTQTDIDDERAYYQSQLVKIKTEIPYEVQSMVMDNYEFYASILHSVVRSLIGMYRFSGDFEWLSKKILPPATVDEVQQSVKLLENLGLISRNPDGVYYLSNKNLWADISVKGKQLFHRACSDIVKKQIFNTYPDDCQILNATLGMSEKTYEFVCEESKKLLEKVMKAISNEKQADRVYQYQLILVPLSQKMK